MHRAEQMSKLEDDGSNDDSEEENVVMTVDYNFDVSEKEDELVDPADDDTILAKYEKKTLTKFEVGKTYYATTS